MLRSSGSLFDRPPLQIQMLGMAGIAKCFYLKATEGETAASPVFSTP
jgi:hypothetical protein